MTSYNDTREEKYIKVPMFPAKSMFNMMKARHELFINRYPHTPEERGWSLTGIVDARPGVAAGRPRVDFSKLPFDPMEFINELPQWEGTEFDHKGG